MQIDSDEVEVLRAFLRSGVRFLIVGGRAVQFHGHVRPAKDLDLLVEFSAVNWARLSCALRPLNASVPPFDKLPVQRPYQAKLKFYPTVEFVTSLDGVIFEQAWEDAVETLVNDIPVLILSRGNLIASKQSSERLVDKLDVAALRGLP